jgi:hypothetical protein
VSVRERGGGNEACVDMRYGCDTDVDDAGGSLLQPGERGREGGGERERGETIE